MILGDALPSRSSDPEARQNSNYALEQLRTLIRKKGSEGKLPTERELSVSLGVSRRAVRRALEVLEAEGAIWRRQGAGTFIGDRPDGLSEQVGLIVAGTNFMEVMEVRLRIEPQLAQLAAIRVKDEDIESLERLVARTYEAEDSDARELWDGALHRQIAKIAGNHFFLSLFELVQRVRQDEAWRAIRQRAREAFGTRERSHAEHKKIIEAIARRDPGQAGEAMRRHLLRLQEGLIRQTSMDHQIAEDLQADNQPAELDHQ